ncbi:MAG: histidine kinase [Eubacteriales bacterium]|nr:histidine kinase [Eubacteriales bacterium]
MPKKKQKETCKNSIRRRMITWNLSLIVVLILSIEILTALILVRSMLKDAEETNQNLVLSLSNRFDDMWTSFKRTMNTIAMDDVVQEILTENDSTAYENGEDNVLLQSAITENSMYCRELKGTYLYERDQVPKTMIGTLLSGVRKKTFPTLQDDWFDQNRNVSSQMTDGRLMFSRIIYSKKNLDTIGYMLCIYDISAIEKHIQNLAKKNLVIVLDKNGEVITSSHSEEQLEETLPEIMEKMKAGKSLAYLPGSGFVLLNRCSSDTTSWDTISVVRLSTVLHAYMYAFISIVVIGITAAVGSSVFQIRNARRITEPLEAMVHSIRHAEAGDYSDHVSADSQDEIAVLAQSYNELMQKTDILVNQVLKGELAYKDAQISALQFQINPHMLYNTFECLNWLAEYGRKDDIRKVTVAFSKLMNAIMASPGMVTLQQELELTENFLLIYKILMQDKLEYSILCDDSEEGIRIPRLTIQPLVENAVIHGIKSRGEGTVRITVSREEEHLVIIVLDDGVGMPPERTEAINAYAAGEKDGYETSAVGIGIRNLNDRLQLIYGEQVRIEFSSSLDWGTVVRMILPDAEDAKEAGVWNEEL